MTPTARLLAAADIVERLGAEATPGPWGAMPNLASREWPPPRDAVGARVDDPATYAPVVDRIEPADAAWIALVGPDTAPDLAAWLRATAQLDAPERWGPALAFADRVVRWGQ